MLGSKVSNLLLAEKNLIDFVDKNLGQERERLMSDELELDAVCRNLTGGILDYPPMISHDFCDITTALDIYVESFTREAVDSASPKFGAGIFPPPVVKNERLSKMPFRGDELSERQFVNAIIQSSAKIRAHIIECLEECTSSGRLENLYVIISNVAMIRNYVWLFQQIFHIESKTNAKLKSEYKELGELVEVISEQMLQCQMNLLTTFVIQDEVSQNWSSAQAYYEGQRGSPTIQMWAYLLKGMERDMWRIMPPQLGQRILGILVNDTLAILTARYSKISPSDVTMDQFCSDIINILGTVEEMLFYISSNMEEFCGNVEPSTSKVIFSIHLKCHCLITSLILVGTPLDVLYKTLRRGLSSCLLLEKYRQDQFIKPMWMDVISVLCPKFYPSIPIPEWELLNHLRLVCAQPVVNWPLVYKVVAMKDCQLACFILQLFTSVQAPPSDFLLEGKGFKRCLKAGCISANCHSLPKSVANHHVSSSVVYLLAHTIPRDQLAKVYHPVLSTVADWSVMDRTQVWNTSTNRPVWFQSLIDLLLPILKTCVQGLSLSLIQSRRAEDDESTQFVVELLNYVTEILSIIPRGFFLICEEIDDLVPPSVYPVRNNVPVHFLVTALYQLLNLGSGIISSVQVFLSSLPPAEESTSTTHEAQDVKSLQPLLLSISERLCHLDDGVFDQSVHRMITQIESMMRQTQAQLIKKRNEGVADEFIVTNELASLKVNFLLEDVEGQLSLSNIYWFLMTHSEVLQNAIYSGGYSNNENASDDQPSKSKSNPQPGSTKKVPAYFSSKVAPASEKTFQQFKPSNSKGIVSSLKISPRTRTYYKVPNTIHDFHYVNKRRTFDEIMWKFNENVDWVSTIRGCKMGFHKSLILRQLDRRPDFRTIATETLNHSAGSHESERYSRQLKMVDEIKALLS